MQHHAIKSIDGHAMVPKPHNKKKKEKSRDPSAFSHAHLVQNTIIHEHGSKNQPPNKPSFIKFFLGGCNLGIHQN